MKLMAKFSKTKLHIILFVELVVAVFIVLGFLIWVFSKTSKEYNQAIEDYNSSAKEYNQLVKEAYVGSISGLYEELPILPEVEVDASSLLQSIIHGNRTGKIRNDIQTVTKMKENTDDSIRIVQQIIAPETAWVIKKIQQLPNVNDIEAVTNDNDPNGMLEKNGGYIGCIYFSIEALLSNNKGAIENGVDGGGAIEIYESVEDAKARCEYLSQYDSTIFYSGSYVIVGTMVIRVSYLLNAQEQFNVTNSIILLLTQ